MIDLDEARVVADQELYSRNPSRRTIGKHINDLIDEINELRLLLINYINSPVSYKAAKYSEVQIDHGLNEEAMKHLP